MVQESGEIFGVNTLLDNILSQKSLSKSFLQQQGDLYMGIGCACTPENPNRPDKHLYTCIIAIASHVLTKDMTERLPVYEPFLQPGEVCADQCEWFYNSGEDYSLPFETFECKDGHVNVELQCVLDERRNL